MRIVHFSDIHAACRPDAWSAFFDKRLLGSLNYYLRRRISFHPELIARAAARVRALKPDWVVCTGDLTSVGSPAEFREALARLSPLTEGWPGGFIYVPGNHDAYVADERCRASLEDAFQRLNGRGWSLDDLPLTIETKHLHFVVVNEACPVDLLRSSGNLPIAAGSRLESWLAAPRPDGVRRLLVGHFPLRNALGQALGWRRRLNGGKCLDRALSEGRLDVSLCGHIHEPFLRREANGALEICAGALTVYGRLNVLDYTPATGQFAQFWVDVSDSGPTSVPVGRDLAVALEPTMACPPMRSMSGRSRGEEADI